MIAAFLVCCGIAYNLLSIVAALRFRRRDTIPSFTPPVSILKPVRGGDSRFYEAIRSHAVQEYPRFEILFGIQDLNDPAAREIRRLQDEFPRVAIHLIETPNDAPNPKVGTLQILAERAAFDMLLVNDGDIAVDRDYLRRVVSLLSDDEVGLVTCLYRGIGLSLASSAEALGIATEFAPSVLVARLLSTAGFALGSTMAFRKCELRAIGGFAVIREYLADDYQLGSRIGALGKRILLADTVVETNLGAGSWLSVWKHQVRWSRTIRVSRPGGYFGYLVTQATFWCAVCALSGRPVIAVIGLAIRMSAAAFALRAIEGVRLIELMAVPFRDLFGFAVWCAGLTGSVVEWRGTRFRLLRDGRITATDGQDTHFQG